MSVLRMKRTTFELLQALATGAEVRDIYHADATVHASAPLGIREGADSIADLWRLLRSALPDMERRDLIFVGGENRDDPRLAGPRAPRLVAALGHLQGSFVRDLLDIPATHGVAHLRYAETHWLDGDRLRESRVIFDLPDLMRQADVWPLPHSLGAEGMWPGPAPQNGLRLAADDWTGPDALETVLAMHDALLAFDGKDLASMPHEEHWTENFMYYAAAGIGMTRGLEGFRAHHQIPFLRAFPDRWAEGHFIRISDGPFAVTGGTVLGTHSAPYLGMTATGHVLRVTVMDFYRLEGRRIAENWLPMDVVRLAEQAGNDLFQRLRHRRGRPDRAL